MFGNETFDQDSADSFEASGDTGRASFGEHGELAKHDARLVAYGQCAEANAAIGIAIAMGQLPAETTALLTSIQNDILDASADLQVPMDSPQPAVIRLSAAYLHRLERAALHHARAVDEPEARVLPGGTAGAALLYFARNVVLRAERAVWRAVQNCPQGVNPAIGKYLNRLATLLLLLARVANAEHGNTPWDPGASAQAMLGEESRSEATG